MTKLLTDLLTMERAEAGKLECKPELMDLEVFCLNLVEDIQMGSETQHQITVAVWRETYFILLYECLLTFYFCLVWSFGVTTYETIKS